MPYTSPTAGWSCVTLDSSAVAPIINGSGHPIASFTTVHGGMAIHLNHDAHYGTHAVASTELILYRNAVHFAASQAN